MKLPEIKRLIISSLDEGPEQGASFNELQEEGVSFDFSPGFTVGVLDRLFSSDRVLARQVELSRYMSIAFSRVALTGVAAIILLLISIFLMEGDLSFNSILGIGDSQTESIVCLLTGY